MLDIDYTGLFSEKRIEEFLKEKSYQESIAIWNTLYNHYKEYTPQKYNNVEFIELKLLLSISLKYQHQKAIVRDLIYKMMTEQQSIRFHMRKLYFKLLNSKEEKEAWLDECVEYYKNNHTYQDVCNFLKFFINEANGIDKIKYKEIYADTCVKIADNSKGIVSCYWYNEALTLYKQLSLKDNYTAALKKYDDNMQSANDDFQVTEFELDDPEMQREAHQQTVTIYDFFKNLPEPLCEKLTALCSQILFKDFGPFIYNYMPFFPKYKSNTYEHSLVDFCNTITLAGNKIIKTPNNENRFDWIGRELTREMQIMPAVQGLLDGISTSEDLENEILNFSLILENDKRHIKMALKAFSEKDYDSFIYIIIPNFEKLLRNVLVLNGIPEYTNKNTEAQFQTTLNLTETIKIIKEQELLHPYVIEKISQELNEEEYENYRNKLSHREDDTIFTPKVAYDLFVLLIQLLKNFEDKDSPVSFIVTKLEINDDAPTSPSEGTTN